LQEFFVWFLFCLCWIESACGRKLRHCTFLVCHTCPHLYPSYVILFPVSARWSFLVKKSSRKCILLTLISHSERECTYPCHLFSIQLFICVLPISKETAEIYVSQFVRYIASQSEI
jgi:hypothetical protein